MLTLWFPAPTALLTQGQKWSNLATSRFEVPQYLDLKGLLINDEVQRDEESRLSRSVKSIIVEC